MSYDIRELEFKKTLPLGIFPTALIYVLFLVLFTYIIIILIGNILLF